MNEALKQYYKNQIKVFSDRVADLKERVATSDSEEERRTWLKLQLEAEETAANYCKKLEESK